MKENRCHYFWYQYLRLEKLRESPLSTEELVQNLAGDPIFSKYVFRTSTMRIISSHWNTYLYRQQQTRHKTTASKTSVTSNLQ